MVAKPRQTDQRTDDRIEIYDVMVRYCHGVDRRNFDMVASCFASDAKADYRGQPCRDLDEIMEHCRGITQVPVSTHFIGNQLVQFQGDVAQIETYAIAYLWRGQVGNQSETRNGLRYLDEMVQRDGSWVIRRRKLVCDWTRTDSVPPGPAPLPEGRMPQ